MSHSDTATDGADTAEAGPSFHPGAVAFRQDAAATAYAQGLDPLASFVHDPDGEALAIEQWDRTEAVRQAAAEQQAELQRAAEAEAAEERRLAPELARLEAEHAALKAEAEKLEPIVREHAFASAGVDISGVGAYVARAYDGEMTPEAIRAEVIELGMVLTGGERGLAYRMPPKET